MSPETGLRRPGTVLAAQWRAHAEVVAAKGDIFGTDPIGSLIGSSYRAAHQIAEESYTSVSDSFAGFGGLLHAMADGYEQTDAHSGQDIAATGEALT